jgi:hypothetical protein
MSPTETYQRREEIIILICMNQLYFSCIVKRKTFNRLYLLMRPGERYFFSSPKRQYKLCGPFRLLFDG